MEVSCYISRWHNVTSSSMLGTTRSVGTGKLSLATRDRDNHISQTIITKHGIPQFDLINLKPHNFVHYFLEKPVIKLLWKIQRLVYIIIIPNNSNMGDTAALTACPPHSYELPDFHSCITYIHASTHCKIYKCSQQHSKPDKHTITTQK